MVIFELENLTAEPNEFRICDKCKATQIKTLLPRLQSIDPEAQIHIGCQSYCGPGRDRVFAFLNSKPLLGATEDELIEKVKEAINK